MARESVCLKIDFHIGCRIANIVCPKGELEKALRCLFAARASGDSGFEPPIEVSRNDEGYSLLGYGGLSLEAALGVIDAYFDSAIRSATQDKLATLHSFGVVAPGGKGIAILGTSAAGKTTLGLACALEGLGLMGDEFAFLDLGSGEYRQAFYPLCVRDPTWEVLGLEKPEASQRILTPLGGSACLLPRDLIEKTSASSCLSAPLGYVVCPERDSSTSGVFLGELSVAAWPVDVMPSVDAPMPRDRLFSELVSLSARKGIRFLRLRYADARSAAKAISELVGNCRNGS